MNTTVRSRLNAVVAQAVGRGLALGTWVALIAQAARELPAADYGQFMLLANLAMLTVLIGSYGFPQVILHLNGRLASNTRSPRHHAVFRLCVRLMASTSLVVALGLGVATPMYLHNGAMGAFLSLAYAIWVLGAIWQGFMAEEAKTVSKFWIAGLFFNSGAAGGATTICLAFVCTVALVEFAGLVLSVQLLVTVLALCSATSAIFLVWQYWRDSTRSEKTTKPLEAAPLGAAHVWRAGTLATINGVLTFIVGQSDLWWAARFFGLEASGQYATASYLARFCSLGSILMSSAFAARWAGLVARGDHAALSAEIRKLTLAATLAGAVVASLLLGVYKLGILEDAFRLSDDEALLALMWLSLGHVVGSFFGFGPVILGAAGNFRDLLVTTALAAGATTVLAALAAAFGDLGTLAIAYAVGYVAFAYLCYRQAAYMHRVRPF